MSEDAHVNVGIVGLGGIGGVHADNVEALSSELPVSLVGGMDVADGARSRFERRYGVPTYGDVADLYPKVDAVVVTTPNRYHEEYVVSALEAGLNVLVEKPLAHTLASATRIAEAARAAEAFCMVGFHNRFAPSVRVLKEYVRRGRLGDVQHVEANYLRRRGIPGRGTWFTDEAVAGGGALIDIGAHAIDLALHFLDFPTVVEVTGDTRSTFGCREDYTYIEMWGRDGDGAFTVDDAATAYLRCENGATISLDVAWAANRPPKQDYVVRGTTAGGHVDRSDGSLTLYEVGNAGSPHFSDVDVTTGPDDAHREEVRRFVAANVADEAPETNTVDEALTVQRVMRAIYESNDRGEAVSMRPQSATADD